MGGPGSRGGLEWGAGARRPGGVCMHLFRFAPTYGCELQLQTNNDAKALQQTLANKASTETLTVKAECSGNSVRIPGVAL